MFGREPHNKTRLALMFKIGMEHTTKIDHYKNIQFESSPYLTAQFANFARAYKRAIVSALRGEFDITAWRRGHFYISAFLKNKRTGKLVHISCSDVRFFPDEWYSNILIRSAEHDKDYTGGANNYTSLSALYEDAKRLTERGEMT